MIEVPEYRGKEGDHPRQQQVSTGDITGCGRIPSEHLHTHPVEHPQQRVEKDMLLNARERTLLPVCFWSEIRTERSHKRTPIANNEVHPTRLDGGASESPHCESHRQSGNSWCQSGIRTRRRRRRPERHTLIDTLKIHARDRRIEGDEQSEQARVVGAGRADCI